MSSPKFILLPAVAALALSLSACNPQADTTSSKGSPGADPMRSAQGPGSSGKRDPAASPTAPGSPSDVMSKEEKERNREALPAPSGVTK